MLKYCVGNSLKDSRNIYHSGHDEYVCIVLHLEMKSWLLFGVLCCILLSPTLTGCREPKDFVFKEIRNVDLQKLQFKDAILKLDLLYYNPNNFGLELKRTDVDIYVNNAYFGKSVQDLQVKIPKRDDFTLPVEVRVDMKNLLINSISTLLNDQVEIRILGKAKVGKAGVFKTFDVDYKTLQQFSIFK